MDPKTIFITILLRENVDTLIGCRAASSLPVTSCRGVPQAAIDWLDAGYNPCVPSPFIGQGDNLMPMLAQRVRMTGGAS